MSTKKPMVQGVGESKNFGDLDAPAFPDALRGRHVGGRPVEELPADVWSLLSVYHTDEDIEERNRGKVESAARELPTSPNGAVYGEEGKKITERRDFLRDNPDSEAAPNPMLELKDKHIKPGMRARFLSSTRVAKEGNYTRGYELVMENGTPVKLGTLLLAQTTEQNARARNARYAQQTRQALREVYQNAREAGVRHERDLDLERRRPQGVVRAPERSEEYFPPEDSTR